MTQTDAMKAPIELTTATGNDLLVETLRSFGVSTIFTLHGGHLDGVYRAALNAGMRLVDTRHEQAAGFAAQGYAKTTSEVGVAMATAGGGVTNLITPIANAWSDAVPIVFFGAAAPLRDFDSLPVNSGFDQLAPMAGITKWAHRATVTELIPQVVARAFQIAREGRPGPVYIDLPTDVLFARVDADQDPIPRGDLRPLGAAPDPRAIDEVARRILAAERPAIIAGGGAVYPDASLAIRELAERFHIPVLTNNKAKGLVPTGAGEPGGSSGLLAAVAKRTGEQADLVLVLGARLGLYTGGRRGSVIPDEAFVVQVDVQAEEIGRIRDIDLGVVATVSSFIDALTARLRESQARAEHDGNLEAAEDRRRVWLEHFLPKLRPEPSPRSPEALARAVAQLAPSDSIFVLDGGETPSWLDPAAQLEQPRRWIGHGYMGIMGEGLPHAVGVQIANPESTVICFTGDGALGFTLGEFDTLVRHRLPVIVVVNNDCGWAMSQHGQDLIYGPGNRMISDLAPSRYDLVAAAFGAHAEFVEDPADFAAAFERARASGLPACINVLTESVEVAAVTRRFVGDIADGPLTDEGLARVPYAERLAV